MIELCDGCSELQEVKDTIFGHLCEQCRSMADLDEAEEKARKDWEEGERSQC